MSILSDEYIDEILSENRELKAEVERLTAQVTGRSGYVFVSSMQEMSDSMTKMALEIESLKAELKLSP